MNQIKKHNSEKTKLNTCRVLLMSIASAICVANLYYSQPLLSTFSEYFHVSSTIIGISAMLIQVGYAVGLLFIVPLGDIIRLRSLIIIMLICSMVAVLQLSFASNILWFTIGSFFVGMTSITQMLLVTLAAHLANAVSRGKVIGTVMTGLLIGMLLSRTFSGFIKAHLGWWGVYRIAAVMIGIITVVFYFYLPQSHVGENMSYRKLLISLGQIFLNQPVLRSSSFIGAMMFASFSAFWTTLSFLLKSPVYHLGAQAAGMFGLLGAVGALAASIAGRVVDKKGARFTLTIGIGLSMLGFICFFIVGNHIGGLIIGIILLDLGIQTAQISNQAKINALNAASRSRNNAVYMSFYFIGGAIGSFFGSFLWAKYGWTGVCMLGIIFLLLAAVMHFYSAKKISLINN